MNFNGLFHSTAEILDSITAPIIAVMKSLFELLS